MNVNWRSLALGLIFSLVIVWSVGFLLLETVIVSSGDIPWNQIISHLNDPHYSFTIAESSPPSFFVPTQLLLGLSMVVTVVLTGGFYLLFNWREKKKRPR